MSSTSKLALLALVMLAILGPTMGDRLLKLRSSDETNNAEIIMEGLIEEVAKEKLANAYYRQELKEATMVPHKPLTCAGPAQKCHPIFTPCCALTCPFIGAVCPW